MFRLLHASISVRICHKDALKELCPRDMLLSVLVR